MYSSELASSWWLSGLSRKAATSSIDCPRRILRSASIFPTVVQPFNNKEITPNEISKLRKQFRTSVIVRNIYTEVLNIIQPIVIKKIKTIKNKVDKKYLNDALLTSIAGISAAMKNTG